MTSDNINANNFRESATMHEIYPGHLRNGIWCYGGRPVGDESKGKDQFFRALWGAKKRLDRYYGDPVPCGYCQMTDPHWEVIVVDSMTGEVMEHIPSW